MLLTFVLLTGT